MEAVYKHDKVSKKSRIGESVRTVSEPAIDQKTVFIKIISDG